MTENSSDPRAARPGSKRRRDPVTLDLKATEIESGSAAESEPSSLVDDPRTPAHPLEKESGGTTSLTDDLPTAPEPEAEPHTPTASEIEAAVAQLAPEAASPSGAEVPPTQDIGEAPPPELAPGPEGDARAAAMPAGAAADRLDERPAPARAAYADSRLDEPEPARRAGLGALLAASLLGGAVGGGLALAAERYWLKTAPAPAPVAQQAPPAAAPPAVDLGPIERRLAALEGREKDVAGQLQAAQSAAQQAAQRAEEALKRPAVAPANGGARGPDPGTLLEPVNARLSALEEQLRTQLQSAAQKVEQLDSRLAEQDKRVEGVAPQIAEQAKRLDAVAAQATQQNGRVAALGRDLAEQNQRLEALAKRFSERGPEGAAALRVVAADRVLDALRDGAPYPQALVALKRLEADPQRLAALEALAQSGAPTAAALAQEFRPLGERLIAEARGPATSWSDRFARMAEGIVSIKPVGETGATTMPALVARIEDALARGDVPAAAAAFDALPEAARGAAEEFGRRLKARAAAEDAARTLSNQALAALDASTR